MNSRKIYLLIIVAIIITSCNDYLDIEPVGKVTPKSVDDYRKFITSAYNIPKNDKILTTYRTDELFIVPNTIGVSQYEDIYTWQDNNKSPNTIEFSYINFYNIIFYTNEIINNKNNIAGDKNELSQLVGEAYALRALQYFNLVNLFGKPYNKTTASSDDGIPLVTQYNSEQQYPVKSVQAIYNQIVNDIEEAEKYAKINEQIVGKNYRFSLIAIKSLKSKIYLYLQEWQKAIKAAQEALAIKSSLQNLNNDTATLPSEYNSTESILALDFVSSFDIITNTYISQSLINSYDKVNDLRYTNYFNETNQGVKTKKNASTKFRCTLRTADLYLMIAEAEANLSNIEKSKQTLLILAKNRYTPNGYTAFNNALLNLDKAQLLEIIYKERQREFAIEGKRWFDLRRTTQRKIIKNYNGTIYTLDKGDSRYTLPLPRDAKINNPLI